MTSSNTLKKLVSIGAAMLLAVGGSLVAMEPASATPVTNVKNLYYSQDWTPGTSFTTTVTSTGVNVNSALLMSDVTSLRGKTLTISSTSSPSGSSDYASIYFYTSLQNAINRGSQIGTSLNIGAGNTTPAVVPQTAVAMRVNFNTSWWGSNGRAIGTYTSMPSVAADGTPIAITTATTGPALYQDSTQSSTYSAYGISNAFTTPSSGSNMYVNGDITGCIDLSLVTSSTTYTATIKINGTTASSPGYILQEHVDPMNMNQNPGPPVSGSTGSFSSNSTLAGWLSGQKRIEISASGVMTASPSTQYDMTLELVDQNNHSLLKDCSPASPTQTGTLAYTSNTLRFTPASAVAASSGWGVNVYKAADDSLVATTTGMGSSARSLSYVVNGVTSAWPDGDYYAKVFVRESFGMMMTYLNSAESSTRSATVTIGTVSAPQTPPSVTRDTSDRAESAKPLPVWAAPILKQIPTLSKTLNTDGGKVSLTDGDFSSLKSVTVGGQAVTYSTDAKGDVNIPIPAGKAGTTADLVVTFTGGKMTIQDGIKYVAPTDVSAVREAPIAGFAKNSTKINGVLAETIQYAAQLDKKANTVLCTGYAPSKAAVATVTAQATAACGYATKVNDQLVNKTVKVVVNAKLAKTAPVGIKVYH